MPLTTHIRTTVMDTPITTTRPDDRAALLRLAAWLSPVFPVGSFSYSHGLERAVHDGLVYDAAGLADWIETLLTVGSGWNDAVLLAEAWQVASDGGSLNELAELAEALSGSTERHLETISQGSAFIDAASVWPAPLPVGLPERCAYPVAVGSVAGAHGVPLGETTVLFLQAFASNLIQAAIRLGVLGQKQAAAMLSGLEQVLLDAASRATLSSLDDLGSATWMSEIAAMNHETQRSRLFRS